MEIQFNLPEKAKWEPLLELKTVVWHGVLVYVHLKQVIEDQKEQKWDEG